MSIKSTEAFAKEMLNQGHKAGEMAKCEIGPDFPAVSELMAGYDWDNSALGKRSDWPYEVANAFSIIENSGFPCAIYMQPDEGLRCYWNDPFAATVARGIHPQHWSSPAMVAFPAVTGLDVMILGVINDRKFLTIADFPAYMERKDLPGFIEESFYDFTMVPLVSPKDACFAVLTICNDVTSVVLQQRRLDLLSKLATRCASAQTVEGVCHSVASSVRDAADIPWMAIYADDSCDNRRTEESERNNQKKPSTEHKKSFRLVATSFDENLQRDANVLDNSNTSTSGSIKAEVFFDDSSSRQLPDWLPSLPSSVQSLSTFVTTTTTQNNSASPTREVSPFSPITLDSPTLESDPSTPSSIPTRWPFANLTSETPYLIVSTPTPTNPHQESIILPITTQSNVTGEKKVLGIMVAGLSEHRMLDDKYYKFFENLTGQLETAILNGRARADDRRAAESLKRLNHERVQFFQNSAHELRTPLTLMLGPLEELVKTHSEALAVSSTTNNSPSNKAQASTTAPPVFQTLSRLSLISRNARRLLKLVNGILRFSSIEAGKLEIKFVQQENFGLVTRQLVECFEPLAAQSGVELRLEGGLSLNNSTDGNEGTQFDVEVEGEDVKEAIFCDVELWEQIIFNLISNAFKHTWSGSITCSLVGAEENGKDGFKFEVRDTGVGIANIHLRSVFERFYRADNSESRSAEGTGIGLSLVKELVTLHGGSVGVTSEVGIGSNFYVWIPRGSIHLPTEKVFAPESNIEKVRGNDITGEEEIEVDEIPGAGPEARSAMDRWNATSRGMERASVLEQIDVWINEPARESSGTPERTATPNTERLQRPPLPSTRDSEASLTTLVDDTDVEMFPSLPLRKKRKPSISNISLRSSSAKRGATGVTPLGSWFTKDTVSITNTEIGRKLTFPVLDPSDRPTILIVDDNADMRLWVSSILSLDFDVIQARNGREALDLLDDVIPDLVLSDVMMPLLDGISLVRQIRSSPRLAQIPVILLSARSSAEDSVQGLDTGASDYILKPFKTEDLLARVRVHIRLNRLRLQTAEYEVELIQQHAKTEAKNGLLSLVSHELRTPLSTIFSAASLLRNEGVGSQDLVDAISSAADILRGRVDQLLDVAKIDSASFELTMAPFDLDSVIVAAVLAHTPEASKKGVAIFSIVSLPSTIVSDRDRLAQVLDVLLSNAVKFTESGEIVLRAWVENEQGEESNQEGAFCCFSVSDSGPGISEDLSAKIFQPFTVADPTSTRMHGGAGLGLALALRVVELAGGQIGVESKIGSGSEFRFRWPMVEQEKSFGFDQQLSSSPPLKQLEPSFVIVSSNSTLSRSLSCTAATYSWRTWETVTSIEEAIQLFSRTDSPHLVIYFIDSQLVQSDPVRARELLGMMSDCPSPSSNPTSAPTRYAIVTSTSPSFADFGFHACVAAPFHRTQVRDSVTGILSRSRRVSEEKIRSPSPVSENPFPRGRLLIAEDNKINAKLLIRQLSMLGFQADEAEHGLKVLDLIQAEGVPAEVGKEGIKSFRGPAPYRAILMDLDMPIMNGFEATRRVRDLGGRFDHLPILAVTANASGNREKCLQAGMDDLVSKPVSIAQLTELLKRNGLYSS